MSITLQAVSAENWREVIELEVGAGQAVWVAPNAYSLLEAQYGFTGEIAHLRIVPLAIYNADRIVGMAMYNTKERRVSHL